MINFNELYAKCKERGINISRYWLYKNGAKVGFFYRDVEAEDPSLHLNEKLFEKWLNKATEKAPDGWLKVSELIDVLHISQAHLYEVIRDKECGAIRIGAGKGVLYADPARVEKVIQERKKIRQANWYDE